MMLMEELKKLNPIIVIDINVPILQNDQSVKHMK
jgi:hypothetical protein